MKGKPFEDHETQKLAEYDIDGHKKNVGSILSGRSGRAGILFSAVNGADRHYTWGIDGGVLHLHGRTPGPA